MSDKPPNSQTVASTRSVWQGIPEAVRQEGPASAHAASAHAAEMLTRTTNAISRFSVIANRSFRYSVTVCAPFSTTRLRQLRRRDHKLMDRADPIPVPELETARMKPLLPTGARLPYHGDALIARGGSGDLSRHRKTIEIHRHAPAAGPLQENLRWDS